MRGVRTRVPLEIIGNACQKHRLEKVGNPEIFSDFPLSPLEEVGHPEILSDFPLSPNPLKTLVKSMILAVNQTERGCHGVKHKLFLGDQNERSAHPSSSRKSLEMLVKSTVWRKWGIQKYFGISHFRQTR